MTSVSSSLVFVSALLSAQPSPVDRAQLAAEQVDLPRMLDALRALQSAGARRGAAGSRVAGTAGAWEGRRLIERRLQALGLTPRREPFWVEQVFEVPKRVISENISVVFGPPSGLRVAVIAHLDSRAAQTAKDASEKGWRWKEDPAPGADDNGSGSAALLELADVLGRLGPPAGIRLELVWAGAEEMARTHRDSFMYNIGAEPVAERYARDGQPVLGALSVDMLLRSRPWGADFRVYSDGRWNSQQLAVALEDAAHLVAPAASIRTLVNPSFTWSDHGSFWARGWGGVLLIEDDFHHVRYHQGSDFYADDDPFYDRKQFRVGAQILCAAVMLLGR